MPNARPTPGLRLTPEKYEQLRGLAEAVEHGTAKFITYEADLAARAFQEIERLEAALAEADRWRKKYEALMAAVIKADELIVDAINHATEMYNYTQENYYESYSDGLDEALTILRQLLDEAGGGDQ